MGEDTTSVLDRGLTAPSRKLLFDALVGKRNHPNYDILTENETCLCVWRREGDVSSGCL